MKYSMLPVILILFLAGCDDDNDIINHPYGKYMTNNSIEAEINFYPVETHQYGDEPATPMLKIQLATQEIFPCVNFQLGSTQFTKDNELIIRFDEIVDPGVCLTALGPARSMIDLPENITKLVFINGHSVDSYQININNEKIIISSVKSNFMHLTFSDTFRYPENSFAYICGTNTDNTHIYNDFLNLLLENESLKAFEFVGEGRIPYPISSSGHWEDHPAKYFKYNEETDFDDLEPVLRTFVQENMVPNDGVLISMSSWNNKSHRSWLSD